LCDLEVAIQPFIIVGMAEIVRLGDTMGQLNAPSDRRRLPRLGYAAAELCGLPEGLPVTIRRARPDDGPAIAHLAEIDEAPIPSGGLLVAEVGGELWAAASVEFDQGISDPFRPSGELLRALAERAGRRRRAAPERRERLSSHLPDTRPRHDGRSHPPLVRARPRASADPAAGRDVGVGREQHHAAVGVERAEHEHLGDERADLPRGEVHNRDDESSVKLGGVVVDDLGGGPADAELATEVDRQLPGRLARFGEGVDGDHASDSHLDPGEVGELDHDRPNIAAPPPWLAWLALGIVYVVWGSTYLAIRVMVQTVPALLGAGSRFVIAGLVLYGWVWARRGRAALRVSRREAAGAACVGILLTSGGNGLVTVAERQIASSLAALVIASVPFAIVLIRVAIGERVSRRALIAVGVGFVGVAILVLPGASAGGKGLVGAMLVLAGAIAWGAGSVSSTRLALPRDLGASTAIQMTAGGAAMLIAGVLGGEAGKVDVSAFSTRSVVAFAYLVVFGSIVAFSAYTWLLQNVPISRVATYAYVNPVIAVFLGWVVLGERISPTMLAGASVIVGSVAVTIRATRTQAGPERKGAQDRPMVATARRRV
jgi:drug/metabolite transporter (DMT)-like permease